MTKETKNKTANAQQLEHELLQFMGDLVRYRHPLNQKVIYTPGVRFLVENAEAYWLIDAIANWIASPEFASAVVQSPPIGHLHYWILTVDSAARTAVLHAERDCGIPPFITQKIEFTDFPLDEICIWAVFDGSHWTLSLLGEH
jgi:hypothetical protein